MRVDQAEVLQRRMVFESAMELTAQIVSQTPLEAVKLPGPIFTVPATETPTSQFMSTTIQIADWLIGDNDGE